MDIRTLVVVSSLFALSACSTMGKPPELATGEMRAKLLSSRVNVVPVARPVQLVERTKGRAVGNFLVASLAVGVVGSLGGPASPQQFRATTQTAQAFGQQLGRNLSAGQAIGSGSGVDLALAARLTEHFNVAAAAERAGEVSIAVDAPLWELGYLSLLGSADYGLSYRLRVLAQEKQPEGVRVLKTVSCQGDSSQKMPLEKWQAEDYREVNTATRDIVENCYKLALAEMGLN